MVQSDKVIYRMQNHLLFPVIIFEAIVFVNCEDKVNNEVKIWKLLGIQNPYLN